MNSDGVLRNELASRLRGLISGMLFDREICATKWRQCKTHWEYYIDEVSKLEEYGQEMAKQRSEQMKETEYWRQQYTNLLNKVRELV